MKYIYIFSEAHHLKIEKAYFIFNFEFLIYPRNCVLIKESELKGFTEEKSFYEDIQDFSSFSKIVITQFQYQYFFFKWIADTIEEVRSDGDHL